MSGSEPVGRVLLVYPLPDAAVEAELRGMAEVVVPADDTEASLVAAVADARALICRGPARITATVIEAAAHLRVIGAVGSGTDNIDVAAATVRGIPVLHGAGVAPRAVAEWAVGALVLAHRGTFAQDRRLREGPPINWADRGDELVGTQLTNTTLGIIGFGHIGRDLAKLALGLDMDVLAYDPFVDQHDHDLRSVRMVDELGELLDASRSVSVHVPLLEGTRGLIGRQELRRIGPDGVLVDAARGGVVDEGDLVDVLTAGELKAAVVDVFADEPPTPAQLRRLSGAPGLIMTPHVAGITHDALAALSRSVARGVVDALRGRRPAPLANPEVRFP